MGRFWGRGGREKVREAKREDSEGRSFLSAPFSVPPLHSKISSPLAPKEGHSHFLNVRHFLKRDIPNTGCEGLRLPFLLTGRYTGKGVRLPSISIKGTTLVIPDRSSVLWEKRFACMGVSEAPPPPPPRGVLPYISHGGMCCPKG